MGKQVPDYKKYIRRRVSEIIQDYLYDDDESYAYIHMYFEKKNGENQVKRLQFGAPSPGTPDEFRDEPEGYDDTNDPLELRAIGLGEILDKKIIWTYDDGTPWDGKTLSQIRKVRET